MKSLTIEQLMGICDDTKNKLAENENYTPPIRSAIKSAEVDLTIFLHMVKPIYQQLQETSDGDQFKSKYMGRIVRHSTECVTAISRPVSNLLLMKMGDKLFAHYKRESEGPSTSTPETANPVTKDCMEGIQYLSGYVLNKMRKKFRNTANILSMLDLMVSSFLI